MAAPGVELPRPRPISNEMDENKRVFGFSRNVFFLGLVSFFNDFSAEMVQSVMPLFLTVTLGAPAYAVGLIEGVADALASVLKVFSGWVSDKIGKRKLPAVLGYALSVGVRPILSLAVSFYQVLSLRIVDRIGKGFRDAPRDALISESVPKSELGKSFGFHRSLDTLGATLGPLLAFLILPVLGGSYRKLFVVAFFIGVGAILSFAFVKDKKPPTGASPHNSPKVDFNLVRTNKRFVSTVFSIFIFGLGTLPIVLLLLKVKEAGPSILIPLVYFIYSLAFVLTAVPLGRLADRIGEGPVIASGFLIAALAYFGLASTTNLIVVLILFVVLGLYQAATDGLERVIAAKAVPESVLATGQGFLNMAVGFSSLFAGIVGGVLWTKMGSSSALSYAGIMSILGLLLFIKIAIRKNDV